MDSGEEYFSDFDEFSDDSIEEEIINQEDVRRLTNKAGIKEM